MAIRVHLRIDAVKRQFFAREYSSSNVEHVGKKKQSLGVAHGRCCADWFWRRGIARLLRIQRLQAC